MNFKLAWSIVPLLGAVCLAAEPSDPPARQSAPPDRPQRRDAGGPGGRDPGRPAGDPVARLMAFDANKDGALTKDEVGDPRFDRLLERADTDKDGKITKEELTAAFAKEPQGSPRNGPPAFAGPPPGDGQGPPDGPPQGNRPPGRGRMGPPMPGQIMPPFVQEQLQLDDAQKEKLAALQKDVDAKLNEILTEDQKKQLAEMRNRRPGPGSPGDRPSGPPQRREDGPQPADGAREK